MTLAEIKAAVGAGRTVHWSNTAYSVTKDNLGQYFIKHADGSAIGLTWRDGVTLNGRPEEFFLADSPTVRQAEKMNLNPEPQGDHSRPARRRRRLPGQAVTRQATYVGRRHVTVGEFRRHGNNTVTVVVVEGGTSQPLHDRLQAAGRTYRHGDGFEWGYQGSGPAELARQILWDVLCVEPHPACYQDFKRDKIATVRQDWTITTAEVEAWVAAWRLKDHGGAAFVTVDDYETGRDARLPARLKVKPIKTCRVCKRRAPWCSCGLAEYE